jgi:translation initiation factor 2 alpha subunit (eIF-2alpha)
MRYYEPRYPEVDELVMVQVRQIAEMGAYVKLVRLSKLALAHFALQWTRKKNSSNMTTSRG